MQPNAVTHWRAIAEYFHRLPQDSAGIELSRKLLSVSSIPTTKLFSWLRKLEAAKPAPPTRLCEDLSEKLRNDLASADMDAVVAAGVQEGSEKWGVSTLLRLAGSLPAPNMANTIAAIQRQCLSSSHSTGVIELVDRLHATNQLGSRSTTLTNLLKEIATSPHTDVVSKRLAELGISQPSSVETESATDGYALANGQPTRSNDTIDRRPASDRFSPMSVGSRFGLQPVDHWQGGFPKPKTALIILAVSAVICSTSFSVKKQNWSIEPLVQYLPLAIPLLLIVLAAIGSFWSMSVLGKQPEKLKLVTTSWFPRLSMVVRIGCHNNQYMFDPCHPVLLSGILEPGFRIA